MLDLDRLLKLRLVVARAGERDRMQWWDTQGVLGARGATLLRRGMPRSHRLAAARIGFEVAALRCRERLSDPSAMTLWALPADLEDAFQQHWHRWLREGEVWDRFCSTLEAEGDGLAEQLLDRGLASEDDVRTARELDVDSEGRAVRLPDASTLDDHALQRLAAAFTVGKEGQLVVPAIRLTGQGE